MKRLNRKDLSSGIMASCLCGNPARRWKWGGWVCPRCAKIENKLSHDWSFHKQIYGDLRHEAGQASQAGRLA